MSEQAKIIAEMQEIIFNVLKTGSASEAEADKLDELEALMLEQKCYKVIDHEEQDYLGEEIASLFFSNNYMEAINKMCESKISPDDFFGFIEYHYDEDEDEEAIAMFTDMFISDVNKEYQSKCKD